jgi:hypothetical protein
MSSLMHGTMNLKFERKRPLGKSRRRWDDIIIDIKI